MSLSAAYLQPPALYVWLIPLLIWSLLWKAMALYKSARNQQLTWFIMLFFIQTVGILDLIYILFFQRDNEQA